MNSSAAQDCLLRLANNHKGTIQEQDGTVLLISQKRILDLSLNRGQVFGATVHEAISLVKRGFARLWKGSEEEKAHNAALKELETSTKQIDKAALAELDRLAKAQATEAHEGPF